MVASIRKLGQISHRPLWLCVLNRLVGPLLLPGHKAQLWGAIRRTLRRLVFNPKSELAQFLAYFFPDHRPHFDRGDILAQQLHQAGIAAAPKRLLPAIRATITRRWSLRLNIYFGLALLTSHRSWPARSFRQMLIPFRVIFLVRELVVTSKGQSAVDKWKIFSA